jgi:hypothetical protein
MISGMKIFPRKPTKKAVASTSFPDHRFMVIQELDSTDPLSSYYWIAVAGANEDFDSKDEWEVVRRGVYTIFPNDLFCSGVYTIEELLNWPSLRKACRANLGVDIGNLPCPIQPFSVDTDYRAWVLVRMSWKLLRNELVHCLGPDHPSQSSMARVDGRLTTRCPRSEAGGTADWWPRRVRWGRACGVALRFALWLITAVINRRPFAFLTIDRSPDTR